MTGGVLTAARGGDAAEAVLRQGRLDRGAPPPRRRRSRGGVEAHELEVGPALREGRKKQAGADKTFVREGGLDVVGQTPKLLDRSGGGESRGELPPPPQRGGVEIVQQVGVGEGSRPAFEASPAGEGAMQKYTCIYVCMCERTWWSIL